jgi:D-arabinose 1-dehydrogenase-like Zn-dependent alcohol dehydrogenase
MCESFIKLCCSSHCSSVKPLSGAGATAYGGLLSVNLVEGQWLAVVGCGGLGHLLIQFAKAKSLKVLAGEFHMDRKHTLQTHLTISR